MTDKGFDIGEAITGKPAEAPKEKPVEQPVEKKETQNDETPKPHTPEEKPTPEPEHHEMHKKAEALPPLDVKKVWLWIVKNKAFLILLIPIILSIYVRTGSEDFPIADQWAQGNVNNFIRADVEAVVNAQYPNLPPDNKNGLIDQQLAKAYESGSYTIQAGQLRGQSLNIENEIRNSAAQLRTFWQYDLNGKQVTYMPDIDPYFYLRYARNYLEHGYYGDEIDEQGNEHDTYIAAPEGKDVSLVAIGFHPIVLAWIFKVHKVINSGTDLMQSAALFPLIIMALATIPAFLLGKRLAGNVGGFFAAAMLAINRAALGRTPWGHADTDAYTVLFAITITWLIVEGMHGRSLKSRIGWSAAAGIITGLYALAWSGWWYMFDFVIAAFVIQGLWTIFQGYRKQRSLKCLDPRHNECWRDALISGITYVVMTALVASAIMGFVSFIQAPLQPLEFTSIKDAAHANLWPNVYTTVAELNPGSVDAAINAVGGSTAGGKLLFALALLGIGLLLVSQWFEKHPHVFDVFLLLFWFIGTIYAVTKGIRFTLLLTPAFAIGFGVALGLITRYVTEFSAKHLRIPAKYGAAFLVGIFVLMSIGAVTEAKASMQGDVPIMNDAWWNALTAIRDQSEPDAIINSWWDFGHHFKFVADRRVTFDGASQNRPQAHWIGNALLTDDEDLSVGILRMLDCGGNQAFDIMINHSTESASAVRMLKEALVLEKIDARKYFIDKDIPRAEVTRLLEKTHCEPPEDYFITSHDMISKAGVWSHFGSWNFERAYVYVVHSGSDATTAVEDLVATLNYSEEEAESIYYDMKSLTDEREANSWISPWHSYLSGLANCGRNDELVQCNNGVQINLTTGETIVSVQGGTGRPHSLVYFNEDDEFKEIIYSDKQLGVSVVLRQDGNNYQSIVSSPELAKSMFTRLYFLGGHGLEHYELFNEQTQLTGGRIVVWNVDWEGHEPNVALQRGQEVQNEEKEEAIDETNESASVVEEPSLEGDDEQENASQENQSSEINESSEDDKSS